MILIDKPPKIPQILASKGKVESKNICNRYNKDWRAYESGKEFKYKIKKAIYGGDTVKSVLKKAQYEKCCFCEKKQGDEYGAVEHFRPKAGYKVARKKAKLIMPGYYWLGYNWDNLFFVCGPCNTKKGNIFPLKDEKQRASNHRKRINLERPNLLNPCGTEDPKKHIKFDKSVIDIKKLTEFGKYTVEICGLNREGLNSARAKVINDIDARLVIISTSHDALAIKVAEDYIRNAVSETGEFSAMVISYLSTKGVVIY